MPVGANKRSIFTETDPKEHGARRKSVAKTYSMSNLVQLELFCDQVTSDLINLLDRSQGKVVDLAEIMLVYAFDVVGELAYGESFGLVKHGGDKDGFAATLAAVQYFSAVLGSLPGISRHINTPRGIKLLKLLTGKEFGTRHTMTLSQQLVMKRIENDRKGLTKDRRDMLSAFYL